MLNEHYRIKLLACSNNLGVRLINSAKHIYNYLILEGCLSVVEKVLEVSFEITEQTVDQLSLQLRRQILVKVIFFYKHVIIVDKGILHILFNSPVQCILDPNAVVCFL
jgi:hypothetical protein